MAIIYDATITPGKLDVIGAWLDRQPWGGAGPIEQVGSYRLDDPDGTVGIEAILVRRGDLLVHVPLTYRGAPLDDGEADLLGTMQHSVLGERWVYDATGDPVALAAFARALRGEQEQAVLEIWEGETMLEVREPDVRLHLEPGTPDGAGPGQGNAVEADADGVRLRIARILDGELWGTSRLVAHWSADQSVVAALVSEAPTRP